MGGDGVVDEQDDFADIGSGRVGTDSTIGRWDRVAGSTEIGRVFGSVVVGVEEYRC